jgi:cystathionine beta-lyase/cystathionine gamma-synthase
MRFETRCIHTGVYKDQVYNSCTTPIYSSSTFFWNDLESNSGYDYTRSGNPTRDALHENIASLEGGIDCRATSTGMSAIAATMYLFKPGDHIVAGLELYGGTFRLFTKVWAEWGIEFSLVDMCDNNAIAAAVTDKTRGIWIETPSNPLSNLTDIEAVVAIAQQHNLTTIADNTFLSPYLQRPLEQGVDVVVHSTTKYLNGHSDVVGGCVVTKDEERAETISYHVNALGLSCSPYDAWLVLRGIKTLVPRMQAHERGAMAVARFLEAHDQIDRVYYPGLESHPHHELARKQQDGFGGMLSFDLKDGREAANRVAKKTRLFQTAESLGGIESLIEYPATMSHASMTAEARAAAGISDGTMRVSVGIESPEDLIEDLSQALRVSATTI